MKKIYLVSSLWGATLVVGIISSVFDLFGLTFLVLVLGMAALAASIAYVIENWSNWQ